MSYPPILYPPIPTTPTTHAVGLNFPGTATHIPSILSQPRRHPMSPMQDPIVPFISRQIMDDPEMLFSRPEAHVESQNDARNAFLRHEEGIQSSPSTRTNRGDPQLRTDNDSEPAMHLYLPRTDDAFILTACDDDKLDSLLTVSPLLLELATPQITGCPQPDSSDSSLAEVAPISNEPILILNSEHSVTALISRQSTTTTTNPLLSEDLPSAIGAHCLDPCYVTTTALEFDIAENASESIDQQSSDRTVTRSEAAATSIQDDILRPQPRSRPLLDSNEQNHDVCVSPTPTHSSFPSSSPPMLFSSSPSRDTLTPPSSSPPISQKRSDVATHDDALGILWEEETIVPAEHLSPNHELHIRIEDRQAQDTHNSFQNVFPSTRKPTLASQKKQHKKLAKPFRSPIINTHSPLLLGQGAYIETKSPQTTTIKITEPPLNQSKASNSLAPESFLPKDYTKKAARQFKSPFSQTGNPITVAEPSATPPAESSLYPSLSIQSLQGKVQKLKQAIKIEQERKTDEDDHLLALISKWRAVGREAAWEVWNIVKDIEHDGSVLDNSFNGGWDQGDSSGAKRQRNWGFEDEREAKRQRHEESAQHDDLEHDSTTHHTLGTMLRYMGIAPETLGWDEEEGDFVGES